MNTPNPPGHDGPLRGRAQPPEHVDIGPPDAGKAALGEPTLPVDEFENRMLALLKLRQQMLSLHARLEYLRLMLRLSGPALPR
jgi:hypothetical protein